MKLGTQAMKEQTRPTKASSGRRVTGRLFGNLKGGVRLRPSLNLKETIMPAQIQDVDLLQDYIEGVMTRADQEREIGDVANLDNLLND